MDDQELLGLAALAGIDVHNLKYEDKKSLIRYAKVVIGHTQPSESGPEYKQSRRKFSKLTPEQKAERYARGKKEKVSGWNTFG